jgi:hypothetical protein
MADFLGSSKINHLFLLVEVVATIALTFGVYQTSRASLPEGFTNLNLSNLNNIQVISTPLVAAKEHYLKQPIAVIKTLSLLQWEPVVLTVSWKVEGNLLE